MKKILTIAAAALISLSAMAQTTDIVDQADGYQWPTDPEVLAKLDKWQDLKFGMLIHWGLYSVPGIVESWNLCNESWVVRPEGSKYEEYKKWYWDLADEFNPTDFNPEQWAQVADDCGMKYVIFTTKHHDGFCLYDSEYSDYGIAHGPFKDNPRKDAAKYVFDAFRGHGFMTGAYFSKPDWHCEWYWNPYYATPNRHHNYKKEDHQEWWDKYVTYTKNQLREITSGRFGQLDILWLDGGWEEGKDFHLSNILVDARRVSPGMLSVDRTIGGPDENYQTPERMVPETKLDHPWESCLPLSNDWGWVPNAPYKSANTVINTLAEISAKGGCLVLGVGPTASGVIEDREVEILEAIGKWLKVNGEAIYNSRPAEKYNDGNIWFNQSKDGKTIYGIYALKDGESLPNQISWSCNVPKGKVVLLSTGKKLKSTTIGDTTTISLPSNLPLAPVAFKFEVK